MDMKDSVTIEAAPSQIWPFLTEPDRIVLWQKKLTRMTPISDGILRLGSQYRCVYVMKGRERKYLAHTADFVPPTLLRRTFRSNHGADDYRDTTGSEEYRLDRKAGGTKVTQTISLRFGIVLGAVIWLFQKFGTRQGRSDLERLKGLVEHGTVDT